MAKLQKSRSLLTPGLDEGNGSGLEIKGHIDGYFILGGGHAHPIVFRDYYKFFAQGSLMAESGAV